ncbi:hypothetical protein G4229_14665 [Listeria seeligeri]|uniref:hypothetical protein n=1 Tax=Listeria seeligeri TaxID=1640 RepID=UPI001BD9EE90|nr:hypothetical protein [Listeria seeligeri]MBT0134886.1 hypothetical protein [Listeria seeligeri]
MKNKKRKIPLYLLILTISMTLVLPSIQASASPYQKGEILINGTDTITSETIPAEHPTPNLQGISSWWEIYSKTKSTSYGPWHVATASKKSNTSGTLSYSRSFSIANSFSGTLKVPKSKLNATLGFNVEKRTISTSSFSVKVKKNKSYKIYYRVAYKKYKVKQRRVNINTWTGQKYYNGYATVYPKKYSYIQFKAVEK